VKAAGYLVGVLVKLTAGMELGHDHFTSRNVFALVHFHGDAATIVLHADFTVFVDGDENGIAMTGHGLVNTIVHHLVDQMVKTF